MRCAPPSSFVVFSGFRFRVLSPPTPASGVLPAEPRPPSQTTACGTQPSPPRSGASLPKNRPARLGPCQTALSCIPPGERACRCCLSSETAGRPASSLTSGRSLFKIAAHKRPTCSVQESRKNENVRLLSDYGDLVIRLWVGFCPGFGTIEVHPASDKSSRLGRNSESCHVDDRCGSSLERHHSEHRHERSRRRCVFLGHIHRLGPACP